MDTMHKAGFVNIFGAPNAGKSTLLNALLGENLVITSPKVQTTRHRILGIVTEDNYQIIFSDTPGIIEPKYKLHEKMMRQVKAALEDADIAILLHDITTPLEEMQSIAETLHIKVPQILLLNKSDLLSKEGVTAALQEAKTTFPDIPVLTVSAQTKANIKKIIPLLLTYLPEVPPYYADENVSDRPVRFFVSEIIREQILNIYHEEIPYHSSVIIQSFQEKEHINIIKAEIIVSRETQKVIMIGKGGSLIKKLGIQSREKIEAFLEKKVHLELFVKVRPKWRDNENYLKEYGYN